METLGLGFHFEDLNVVADSKTIGRTITEPDIVNFVNATGMTEVLFTNLEYLKHESDIKGRLAPGALVFCFAEGLLITSSIQKTGVAFLHMEFDIKGPTFGRHDPRRVRIVEARRSNSRPDRGLPHRNVVRKQDGSVALEYTPLRMIKARGQSVEQGRRAKASLARRQGRCSHAVRLSPYDRRRGGLRRHAQRLRVSSSMVLL